MVCVVRRLVKMCLLFCRGYVKASRNYGKVLGVITVQSSGAASGHCGARDHASAQYPVTGVYFATGTVHIALVSH